MHFCFMNPFIFVTFLFQIIAIRDVFSLDAVGGLVSGLTGGNAGSVSSTPVDNAPDNNLHYGTDGYNDGGEFFTMDNLPECGLNEYYEYCGSTCLESCKAFRYNFTIGVDCDETCEEGCFCKPGFRRHPSTGACLLESCCPQKDPFVFYPCDNTIKYCGGQYEVFREEFNECLESCDINPLVCSTDVMYKGCFCEDGFKRNYKGVCVPEKQCYYKNDGYIYQSKNYERKTQV